MAGWADHWKYAWYSIHPWGGSRSVCIHDSCVCSSQGPVSIFAAWCSDSLSCKPISVGCCPGLRCPHDCTSHHECHFNPKHSLTGHLMNINFSTGLDFIRAEGFVFSHVADEGLLNACAGELLRYRRCIGAEHIQIFTDIKKKHRYDQIWVCCVQLADHRALKEAQHSVVVSVLLCHMITCVIFENGRTVLMP